MTSSVKSGFSTINRLLGKKSKDGKLPLMSLWLKQIKIQFHLRALNGTFCTVDRSLTNLPFANILSVVRWHDNNKKYSRKNRWDSRQHCHRTDCVLISPPVRIGVTISNESARDTENRQRPGSTVNSNRLCSQHWKFMLISSSVGCTFRHSRWSVDLQQQLIR